MTIDTKNNIVHCFNDSLDDKFKTFKLSNPIKIVDGQIMLPLREIYENLNCEVTWDDKARNVTVTDKNAYEELDKKADYLMGENEKYDFDTIKEEGSLTDEEIVCIGNMREFYDGVVQALEKTNPHNINSLEDARKAYEKMNSTYMELCDYKPSESFKELYDDFKKNYEANVEYYRDMIESISEFSDDEDIFFSVYWDDWYSFYTDGSITIRKFEDDLIRFAVERNISPDTLLLASVGEEEYISIKQEMETESGKEIYYAAQYYIDSVIEETGSAPENITVDILLEQGILTYKPDMEYTIYVDKENKKVEKVTWKSDVFSDGEGVFQGVNASEFFGY